MKYFIHTTGCKANQWDSHAISGKLHKAGFSRGALSQADIVIINACTLTQGAERDIRRFINHCRSVNKGSKIVLAGCHAQVYPDNAFGADVILGQEEKFLIEYLLTDEGVYVKKTRDFSTKDEEPNHLMYGRTRFFLKIQDGCDRFCSYCVVPYARGKPRSKPVEEVLKILKVLKDKKVREVVLTGIEIASYSDMKTGADLKKLLVLLAESATPERIRLSSVDPLYIDDEFIDIISGAEKIAKSLHIPLQSGCDRVLEKMGRGYSGEYMRGIISKLKRKINNIGIGLDVIAGFPTEDEGAFMETYRFLESVDIYYLHVFPYSARPGTAAFSLGGDIPEYVKKERVRILRRLDTAKREAYHRRFLDSEAIIVPEGKCYKGLYMRGYTDNYLPVYVPFKKSLENQFIRVRIKELKDNVLFGEPAKT